MQMMLHMESTLLASDAATARQPVHRGSDALWERLAAVEVLVLPGPHSEKAVVVRSHSNGDE